MTLDLGTAVVTGASGGIGGVYADRLARRGYDLVLVARNQTRLDALASTVSSQTGRAVRTMAADLSADDGVSAIEHLLKEDGSITMLVNNAGVGAVAPLLQSDARKMSEMIRVNVDALMRLAYAAAPAFVARGEGTVINVASAVAFYPELLNGDYDATKSFAVTLTLSMHHELKDKGVVVQAVCPGAIETEFWELAGLPISNLPKEMIMTASDVVDAVLAGLDLGEVVTIPSLPDASDWEAFEAARRKLVPNLSRQKPAGRIGRAHERDRTLARCGGTVFKSIRPRAQRAIAPGAIRKGRRYGMNYVYKTMKSPVGLLRLVGSDAGLAAVLWERDDPRRVRLDARVEDPDHPVLVEAERQLGEYFAGERQEFALRLDYRGTPFQKKVWDALLCIPFGETRTYGELARQIGSPATVRAVGAANGKNPIAILGPCHRVIGFDGQAHRLRGRARSQGNPAAARGRRRRRTRPEEARSDGTGPRPGKRQSPAAREPRGVVPPRPARPRQQVTRRPSPPRSSSGARRSRSPRRSRAPRRTPPPGPRPRGRLRPVRGCPSPACRAPRRG